LEDTNSFKYLLGDLGNTAYLIDASSASGNVVLPNTVDGASVTLIGDNAFYGCTSLASITIGDSVTSIGNSAFYGCSSLTSITIPNSVTSIGDVVFNGCSSLTSITIPKSVTSIGYDLFGGTGGMYNSPISSINTITLPYKFAGSAEYLGIPGDAEITVNFDDVSEGLLANTNFVAGISEEVTFDSSAIDQAIADEAQARADADVMIIDLADQAIFASDAADVLLQADVDQNEADSDAADANLQQQINNLQTYIDTAVEQARADGVTAGILSVTSDPQSYQLYNESSIMEMNVSNPTLSMLNDSEQAQVEFTLETSTDLEDWNIEERIQRTVQATGDKFFVRIKSGVPYVTPTVLVFNHPSYGEILTDQSGNVLYGFSIDSIGGDPIYIGAAWPLAPQIADPEPDAGVTAALTSGTFSNASGGPWLKINNRPVYTYASDSEPNQASGHGLGSVWFTIKPDGTLNQ
jgi:predicted lipoprotein with Yx(FWY)xxD motif